MPPGTGHKLSNCAQSVLFPINRAGGRTRIEFALVDPQKLKANGQCFIVEAEIVFAIRCGGQWPPFQTGIHFHPSDEVHRPLARFYRRLADVMSVYRTSAC
jgi:hypothetical protein